MVSTSLVIEHRTLKQTLVSTPINHTHWSKIWHVTLTKHKQSLFCNFQEKAAHAFLQALKPESVLRLELWATSYYHVMLEMEANMTEGRVKRWRGTKS